MDLYTSTTEFNCGIDLHSKNMYVCVMNRAGNVLLHRNISKNNFQFFLKLAAKFVHDLTIACESTFNWYWLADACREHGIKFALGHALYMRCIHGGKTKNDKVDSKKIADLLRTNYLPIAHCCSKEKRPIRELLRRRITFVRYRAGIKAHLSSSVYAPGVAPLTREEKRKSQRDEVIPQKFGDENLRLSAETDLAIINFLDMKIRTLELMILKQTRKQFSVENQLLLTVPGIGETLSLVLLYEVDDISRFKSVKNFCSYCRVITPKAESGGKSYGSQGAKMGNAYLKWAFSEAAVYCRKNEEMKNYFTKLERKHGKRKAHNILSHRLARAVYYVLKNRTAFDMNIFMKR